MDGWGHHGPSLVYVLLQQEHNSTSRSSCVDLTENSRLRLDLQEIWYITSWAPGPLEDGSAPLSACMPHAGPSCTCSEVVHRTVSSNWSGQFLPLS